jgi:hypothetical protein
LSTARHLCVRYHLELIGRLLIGILFLMPITGNTRTPVKHPLSCLSDAYPDKLLLSLDNQLSSVQTGQHYPYQPEKKYKDFQDELDHADLFSQLRQPYRKGLLDTPPQHNEDPGRLRHMPLFMDMYGKSSAEVAQNLIAVDWAPCQCKIQFSKVNGAARALEAVGREIHQAGLSKYVQQSLGTYQWRNIAGTQRLSMHALGVAVDFKLPNTLGRYWRWDTVTQGQTRKFPFEILLNEDFNQIVNIFESKGFVWGGKWWHYDSIHFEYRPELTLPGCGH